MTSNKKYFWLKLKDDFFKQKEMKKLRKIAGGDTFTIIYLKLMLLSMKTEGILEFSGIEDTFAEELALEIDEDADNVGVTLNFLKKCNLLEVSDDKEIFLNKVPEIIGKESESAERVRRLREKLKTKALQCNVDVTKCNIEIEKEKEIEKDKKNNKKGKLIEQLNELNISENLKQKFIEFIAYRKEIKKPLKTIRPITSEINKIGKDYQSEEHLIESIDFSMDKEYQGIFPTKNYKTNKDTKPSIDTKIVNRIGKIEMLLDTNNIIYEKDKLFLEETLTDDRYSKYRYILDKIDKAEIV